MEVLESEKDGDSQLENTNIVRILQITVEKEQ